MTTQEVDDLRRELTDLKSLVNRLLDAIYAAATESLDDNPLAGNLWRELYRIVEDKPRPDEA